MSLGDLHKKLYSKDKKIEERELAKDAYDSSDYDQVDSEFSRLDQEVLQSQEIATEEDVKISKSRRKFFLVAGAILSLIMLFVAGSYIYSRVLASYFNEERLVIEIEGAREVKNTLDTAFVIRVKNQNRIGLGNVNLRLNYSDSMLVQKEDFLMPNGFNSSKIEIGQLAGYEEREFKVSFNFFGPQGKQAFLDATLSYQPDNFSSFFQANAQKIVEITPSPLNVEIISIGEASSGELTELTFVIDNETSENQSDLIFKIDYPEGFSYEKANPAPDSEDNSWKIDQLKSGEQISIFLSGRIDGQIDSLQRFKASLGKRSQQEEFLVFTQREQAVKVIPSRINIYVSANSNAVYTGTLMEYQVFFQNNSNIPLRDLILYAYIDGDMVKERTLSVKNGFYDSENKKMIWMASDLPSLKLLEPGARGSASFSIQLNENMELKSEKDFNKTVASWAEIESLDVNSPIFENKTIRSQQKIVKIKSSLYLNQTAVHGDLEIFDSFGPSKVQSEKESSVTITYNLRNSFNNLSGTTITTSLPTGIIWKDKIHPENSKVSFNVRTNEMEWEVGDISAGTGFLKDPITLSFQLGVKPSILQEGKSVLMIKAARGLARDLFCGQPIGVSFHPVWTESVKGFEFSGNVFPSEDENSLMD